MKRKDLLLGDIVKHGRKVITIDSGNLSNPLFTTRFVPIPLTANILEKSGFEYNEERECYESEFFDLHHIINSTWGVGDTMMRVTYVHELQHAVGLCDCRDNFKICLK